jgi:hypothetical protein
VLQLESLRAELEKLRGDALLSSRWTEVEHALRSFERGDYHSALRTLLPVIEHVLREIAVREGVAGTDKGMHALLGILVGRGTVSEDAEGYLKALKRNEEVHGLEVASPFEASLRPAVALAGLVKVVESYRRYELVREALAQIAPQLGLSSEELLKAYPRDRSVVHVQPLPGGKLRITVKGEHVFEVERRDGGAVSVKRA